MKYYLIDMANIPEAALGVVEKAFVLWKAVYFEELAKRSLKLHEDDFWNCRILTVIEDDNGQVIGSHIYNSYDLRTSLPDSHKYFKDVPVERVQDFRQQGVNILMSMEYLLVNPLYRGSKSPVRWGEVLIGLGLTLMLHSPWDAMIGIARADKKVNQMSMKLGCQETDSLVKNQTPCRIVFVQNKNYSPHEDPKTREVIANLWKGKTNWAPHLVQEPDSNQQAA